MANVTFYKRIILLLFLVFSLQLFSQKNEKIKEFSTEFSVFQKQLKDFMLDSDNSELRSTYKTFANSSSSFTASDQLKIIHIKKIS